MVIVNASSETMAIKSAQVPVLKQLCKCNNSVKRKLLKHGGKPLQLCLRECALNVVKGNVPLSKHQFKKLKRYRKQVRELSKPRTSQKKRLQIEQKGGFLASLLLPIIGSVVQRVISKRKR